MAFTSFIQSSEGIKLVEGSIEIFKNLEPNTYAIKVKQSQMGLYITLTKTNFSSDEILDLPSKEYDTVTNQMRQFLKSETKELFNKLGFLYKRSTLLHGLPGTGKTCITSRVARDVVNAGGVVFLVKEYAAFATSTIVTAMKEISPETLILVIIEELDEALEGNGEAELLTILDGQVQRPNTMYLATTNYIDKIPSRILRPGRMSAVIQVNYPDEKARKFYLTNKLGPKFNKQLLEKSDGLSIDSLKELILATQVLNQDIDETVKRLLETQIDVSKRNNEGDSDDSDAYSNAWAYALRNRR